MVVALEAFWAVGWIMAALIGYFVVPTGDDGWRWALAVGLVPAAYALDGVCVVSAIMAAPDPRAAAAGLLARWDAARA